MGNEIRIVYVDDEISTSVSQYFIKFDQVISGLDVSIDYSEYEYKPDEENYENFMKNEKIIAADLIILDSQLYVNSSRVQRKIRGEELKLLLKKFYPYKETFVITQQEFIPGIGILQKYNPKCGNKDSFYSTYWNPVLRKAVEEIKGYREFIKTMESDGNIDVFTFEKIKDNLENNSEYDGLSKKDIDMLITEFQKLKGNQ